MTELSVLVASHNAWAWTERALAALDEHTECSFEVVVVDNASTDGTLDCLPQRFPEARLVVNDTNEGFGPATNRAAELARSPVVLLLNTDAVVGPGWYPPLAEQLDRPGVGAVVPALVNPNGSLQGAGALLGADGSVVSYGAGADVGDARFAFRRVVPFGPAACLLMRRADFLAVGGLDPVYAPAYFEDVDLCFKLAERGLRTVYEPEVRVLHGGFASSGPGRALELYERHRPVFVKRWGPALAPFPPTLFPSNPRRELAARDATAEGRVLFLVPELGAPDDAVRELVRRRPWARLSVLAAAADAAFAPWWELGVEVFVEPGVATILEERSMHYDVVVSPVEYAPLVARHQQCATVLTPPASADAIEAELRRLGI
ncbi:MAG: glycosyltransferase family 2 protein [Solirubrobacterales bacterium]|nr:glycosyltransferase family 2 protein [Solirubrobacterales bacterium]